MKTIAVAFVLFAACSLSAQPTPSKPAAVNYAAVPLVTHNPYFSVWSMTDKLTDNWPRHWSGGTMGMTGLLWVDGKCYRWCGPMPQDVPAAEQETVGVRLVFSEYSFKAGGVTLRVTFKSPVWLGGDASSASPSISSVRIDAIPNDGGEHQVRVYLDLTGEWCTNDSSDQVSWSRHRVDGAEVLSMGKVDQPVLKHAGDQRKIDWGRVYLAGGPNVVVAGHNSARNTFAQTGKLPASDDLRMPRAASDDWPVLAAAVDLGAIPAKGHSTELLIAYDEGEAIELFGRRLKPLWQAKEAGGMTRALQISGAKNAGSVLATHSIGATEGISASTNFELDLAGRSYADLIMRAYRQVIAGHAVVADWDGTPMMFSKENTSNGCIATVDVIYPACPFFLYHNPAMLRAQLLPLMQYAASPRWKFPFAPHDLGTYPKANGQVYGGGERDERDQMPVEESGNMLIMLAALAKVEPQESIKFCEPYWPVLEKWAVYLKDHGLDPANQLCTDDFAGHIARNVNLSAKTVVALGGYAQLLRAAGKTEGADRWQAVAQDYAKKWMETAKRGEATSLVFGDAGEKTWSQKYNLIWDRVLGLNLFPQEVFDRETALYRTKLQKYGLPLDNRRTYTKLDWTCWSACLSGKQEDFEAIMAPVYQWANASPPPSRVPLSDWYETTNGRTMGMHTRTVVGGLWMPLLIEKMSQSSKDQPPVR